MKKFSLKFLPFFLMALCACCLPACSDDDDDAGSGSVSPIVGTWMESYETENDLLCINTFVFQADGSGLKTERLEGSNGSGLTLDPVKFSYTYNSETETIRLKFDGDGTLYTGTASITGNTLVLRYNNTYYNLKKQ